MKSKALNTALLFLTALIWGVSFVAQSVGMEYVEPFTFIGVRTTMGGLALLPVVWLRERQRAAGERRGLLPRSDRKLWQGGVLCGLIMALATNLQQFGIQYTTVGKCGFITAFYVVLVPVFSLVLLRRRYGYMTWLGVAVAMAGMYLLCITESFTIGKGDVLVLLCAVVFALQILAIDHYAGETDGLRLSCLQFIVCGAVSLVCMALFEEPELRLILNAWKPLLYSGLLSCAVGYTLQVLCQKQVEPTVASLILSLESVFSALAGWALLHERLSGRELLGCALTFGAVILVELAPSAKKKERKYVQAVSRE